MEKRAPIRLKKRLRVNFGIDETNRAAFTEDISTTGVFIRSANVCTPDTRLSIEFLLDDGEIIKLEGRVMWAKKVPQNLFHLVKKSGMGIRILKFHSGQDRFLNLCSKP
jgi:hypothetical protein